jgi:hypothetical protein
MEDDTEIYLKKKTVYVVVDLIHLAQDGSWW